MSRARQLGRWVGELLRPQNRSKLIALLILGCFLILIGLSVVQRLRNIADPTPAPRVITKTAAEIEADKARAEAERQAEAERRQQAEAERRRQAELREIQRRQEEEKARRASRDALNGAIKGCVSAVRQRTETRYYRSSFDAYSTEETISYFGTAEERFQFEKCMAERGHALRDKK